MFIFIHIYIGEDDMAFVTAADAETITISNDVITMPDSTPSKQLMSGRNICIIIVIDVISIILLIIIIYHDNYQLSID
jgi:hypothetical protein